MEGKRGSECLLKSVSNIDFNPPMQMKSVLAKIAATDVQSLFVETSVSPKSMAKVAQETGLPIYAKIFTDSLAQ